MISPPNLFLLDANREIQLNIDVNALVEFSVVVDSTDDVPSHCDSSRISLMR